MDDLRADCGRCAGLCCVSLGFSRSSWFSFDKPAHVPCRHLVPLSNRCAVHHRLQASGLAGCAAFDCHGAGQRVTQEIFPGLSWRQDEAVARAMFDAFDALRRIHALRLLLRAAERLALPPDGRGRREELLAALEPPGGWTASTLSSFDAGRHEREVGTFLRGLRGLVRAADIGPSGPFPM